jgi:hypothetical protein
MAILNHRFMGNNPLADGVDFIGEVVVKVQLPLLGTMWLQGQTQPDQLCRQE